MVSKISKYSLISADSLLLVKLFMGRMFFERWESLVLFNFVPFNNLMFDIMMCIGKSFIDTAHSD